MIMIGNRIHGVKAKIKIRYDLPYYAVEHLGLDTDSGSQEAAEPTASSTQPRRDGHSR